MSGFLLFGAPGVGKTSFALSAFAGKRIALHTCTASTDMPSVFGDLIEKLDAGFVETERTSSDESSVSVGADKVFTIGEKSTVGSKTEKLFKPALDLNHVLSELEQRQDRFDALLIDEFHRVTERQVHEELLELIKGCADRQIKLSIVVAGQAGTAGELVKSEELAAYLERSIRAFQISPLTQNELADILTRREQLYNIKIEPAVQAKIVEISGGSVSMVHLLGQMAGAAWVSRKFIHHVQKGFHWFRALVGRTDQTPSLEEVGVKVEMEDLRTALRMLISSFESSHPEAVQRYEEHVSDSDARAVLAAVTEVDQKVVRYDAVAARAGLAPQDVRDIVRRDWGGLFKTGRNEFAIALPAGLWYLHARQELQR